MVKYVITVGETESLQAPLEVEDGEVPHKLLLTLGAFEHSQFSSIHYAVSVLQLFSTEIFNILLFSRPDSVQSPEELPPCPTFSSCTAWRYCCSSPSSSPPSPSPAAPCSAPAPSPCGSTRPAQSQ